MSGLTTCRNGGLSGCQDARCSASRNLSHDDRDGADVDDHSGGDRFGGDCSGQCALLDLPFSTVHYFQHLFLPGDDCVCGDCDHSVLLPGGGERHCDRSDCSVQGSSLCCEREES